ncbi:MAG TPA: hypothetical protein VLA34_01070, partial [Candidatus Krumholzibacterium sp.]|nr:hypothetical protein [Candidatus Krumholzibacterium sp.]
MNAEKFLKKIRTDDFYSDQINHLHMIEAKPGSYGDLAEPLPELLGAVLARTGIERLYTHQAEAVGALRKGENTVIVTSTASGKTLC